MIRGISFTLDETDNHILYDILKPIDITKYFWHIVPSQEEVWDACLKHNFFDKSNYIGEEFKVIINKKHRIIFLKLQAYTKYRDIDNINTFKDFVNDSCDILILIYDCVFCEIYCAKEEISRKFYKCISKKYRDVAFITEANDCRTDFNIL